MRLEVMGAGKNGAREGDTHPTRSLAMNKFNIFCLFLSINREFNNITEQKQRPGLGIMSFFTGVGRRWEEECPPHKGVRRGKRKLTVFGKWF